MFIKWLLSKMLKRKYIAGTDLSNGNDFNCNIVGYIDKNGKIQITKQEIFQRMI